jgi:hypothetical protein
MKLKDVHNKSLATSSALSEYYMKHFIAPLEVITVLNNAKVQFMLVGAHGIGGWMKKSRATNDVDVIVAARGHKKAIKALTDAFPQLFVDDLPVVTRLRDRETQDVAIDVMKTHQDLFREALKNTVTIHAGRQAYKIPSLEMALALKFAPMVSIYRSDIDKYQDAHDFGKIVVSNPEIAMEKLVALGELVYPGGGKEIVEKVRQVRAGEKLNL